MTSRWCGRISATWLTLVPRRRDDRRFLDHGRGPVVRPDVAAHDAFNDHCLQLTVSTATEPPLQQPLSPSQVVRSTAPRCQEAAAPLPARFASRRVFVRPPTVVVKRGTRCGDCVRNTSKVCCFRRNPGLNSESYPRCKDLIPGRAVAAASAAAKSDRDEAAALRRGCHTTATCQTETSSILQRPTKEYNPYGELLGKIAYASGITVRALKEMNKLSSDTLKVGQVILVPAEKVVATKPAVEDVKKAGVKPAAKKSAAPVAEPVKASAEVTPPVTVAKPVQAPVVEAAASAAATDVAAPAVTAPAQAPVEAGFRPAVSAPVDRRPLLGKTLRSRRRRYSSCSIAWGISPSKLMDSTNLKARGDCFRQFSKLPANAKRPVKGRTLVGHSVRRV